MPAPEYAIDAVQQPLPEPLTVWNSPGMPAQTFTYSFESGPSNQFRSYTGWTPFTAPEMDAVRWGLSQYALVGNLKFVEQPGGSADPDIVFGKVQLNNDETWWNYSYTTDSAGNATSKSWDAQIVFRNNIDLSNVGSRGAILHEVGHALMNKHPGPYDSIGSTPPGPYLPAAEDNTSYTVMSYNGAADGAVSYALELYDIAAIQARFGSNFSANTGDTNYTFNQDFGVYSIWDTAGFDTIDGTFAAARVTIDLRDGHFSQLGSVSKISVAYGVQMDAAIGSKFADTITGNEANNRLTGGPGNDRIEGGPGFDTALFNGRQVDFTWTSNSDQSVTVTDLRSGDPEGVDSLTGVEALKFLDATVNVAQPAQPTQVEFTTTTLALAEGNTQPTAFVFTVARTGDTSFGTFVDWAVTLRDSSGLDGADFVGGALPKGVLNFAPGDTTKDITVDVAGDKAIETDDGFKISLSSPNGATLGRSTAFGTIYNDDNGSAANARFSIDVGGPTTQPEGNVGNVAFAFVLRRYDDLSDTSSVDYVVEGGVSGTAAAATDAADFEQATSGSFTFTPGQAEKAIVVVVHSDTTVEPDEGFTVRLLNPQNAYIMDSFRPGMNGRISAVITNDDTGSGPPATGNVYNSPGPGSTVTAGPGDDTINASQGPDVLTGGAGRDTFAWAGEPWSPATIKDFVVGTDRLNFSALFNAAHYTGADPVADHYISLTAQGADTLVLFDHDGTGPSPQWPNYVLKLEGVAQAGLTWSQLSGSGDAPPPTATELSLFSAPRDVPEGPAGQVTVRTLTVHRSGDLSGTSTVNWAVEPGTVGGHPVDGADFDGGRLPAGMLTFEPGVSDRTFDVRVAGDAAFEANEDYSVVLSRPTGATFSGAIARQFTIANDDADTTPSSGQVYNSPRPGSTVIGGAGDDTLNASQGSDILIGGGGRDTFAWAAEAWSPATIKDFVVGTDRIDFAALFRTAAYTGADPVADHYISLTAQGADTLVLFDHDGTGPSPQWPNYVLKLEGVAQAGLTWAQLTGSDGAPPPPPGGQVYTSPGPGSTVTAGPGNDTLVASQGPDVLTSGGGADAFAYRALPWNAGHVTDFMVGTDRLDLSGIFQASGYAGSDPVADGRMSLQSDGAGGTKVFFDRDAPNAGDWPFLVTTLDHVSPTGLTWAQLSAGGGSPPPPSGEGQVLTSPGPGSTVAGGAGDDTLNASQGPDVLTGGGGADHFAWAALPWNPGRITDFTPGVDKLDLRQLFASAGYAGSDPIADHRLEFRQEAGGTAVYLDRDAADSGDWPFLVTRLDGVNASQITQADWIFA